MLRTFYFIFFEAALFITPLFLCSQNISNKVVEFPCVGLAFWDVDRLYDTSPSLFYSDDNFTSSGELAWSEERYRRKVANVAAVIDSMRLPIVMLYGVESRDVVCDIVRSSGEDYTFAHATRNSLTGLDFALLYFGDVLYVDRVVSRRDMLIVEGELLGEPITIVGTISGRHLDEVAAYAGGDRVVVAGRYDCDDLQNLPLYDCFAESDRMGYGNTRTKRGWRLEHRVAIGAAIDVINRGVYIKEWLLTEDRVEPLSTYDGKRYMGGYSNYLPVFVYFR